MKNEEKDHPQVGMLGDAARARSFVVLGGGKPCCERGAILVAGMEEQDAVLQEVLFEDQQTDGLTSYCRDLVAEVLGSDDCKPRYLIVSEHPPTFDKYLLLFWAPDSKGYTVDVSKAGRYTRREALSICRGGTAKMVDLLDVVKKMVRVVRRGDAMEMIP